MKSLESISFELPQLKRELREFEQLLNSKVSLTERGDILPFFRNRMQLSALLGSYNSGIHSFDRVATEFDLFGQFTCDLVIGDSVSREFCFVEFDDALRDSVFVKKRGKSTHEWSPRLDRGFSQILDWFMILEDQKHTPQFKAKFEGDDIQYVGLLIVGRRHYLSDSLRTRLRWRSSQLHIGARRVHCVTFDDLYRTLELKIKLFE